jgi:hypothetical protein
MNIVQIQNRVQELPNTPQTMQYLNSAMNGQVATVPPYIAAAELKRRETEGMMDQLAKGAAQGPQPTVKDQLQQKAGIMALMGQQQPPQRPQIPQPSPPEQQPQAGGIDSLPVKDDMFGMAGGGIVAFNGEGRSDVPAAYETPYDRMNRENREQAAQRAVSQPLDIRVLTRLYQQNPELAKEAALRAGPAGAALLQRVIQSAQSTGPTVGSVPAERESERAAQRAAAQSAMAPASVLNAPSAVEMTGTPAPSGVGGQRPPGQRPPAPRSAAPAAPQQTQAQAQLPAGIAALLESSPEFKRVMEGVTAKNPYAGPQESQADYIKRMTEGIRSQMPEGKMPFETSEERLRGIEARRAKEDADYKAMTTGEGRRLDNLATFLSGVGPGSFGMGGAQGVRAVQQVEREQQAEALKRQDMRDQQAMKMAEIRTLNDQAQFALAQGNVQAYERLTQEAKKLQAEFNKDQAVLARGAATLRTEASKADLESRDKAEDRASRERTAWMGLDGKGTITPNQRAMIADKAKDNVANDIKTNFALQSQIRKDPTLMNRLVAAETERLLAAAEGRTISAAPGASGPGGTTRMRFDAQGNLIK